MTTRRQLTLRVLVLAIGICILAAACGSDDKKTAAVAKPAAASSAEAASAYCDTARDWAVHELTPVDVEGDAAAARTYFAEYVAFNHKGREQAPAVIRDEWNLSAGAVDAQLVPVLEKYGYDLGRLMSEGSDAEKALLDQPPEDVQHAQDAIHLYESKVCAAGQPPAAEVDFSKEKKAAAYCQAVGADDEMTGKVLGAGADPEAIRKLATSKEFLAVLKKEHDNAPAVIKADTDAMYTFVQHQHLPLLERRGYDFRKILLDGPQADREILNSTSPEVRNHFARIAAYDEQVCGQ
jgi:hypothetical protein